MEGQGSENVRTSVLPPGHKSGTSLPSAGLQRHACACVLRAATSIHASDTQDPWSSQDPWGQYLATKAAGPTAPPRLPPQPAKGLDGQAAARLTEQDRRLHALETSIAQLQGAVEKESVDRKSDLKNHADDLGRVRADMQLLSNQLGQQLSSSIDSLRCAQAQQEQQVAQGMAELKQLILAQAAEKRPRREDSEL